MKYVVIDLEMCVVAKNFRKECGSKREIIQLGAVLVNGELTVSEKFSTYVKPSYGWIEPFIEKLTGISQEHVKDAPRIGEAVEAFLDWLPKDEEVTAVSWSLSDKAQFEEELRGKGLSFERMDRLLETWVDCQATFTKKIKAERNYSLSEAMIAADIVGDGREHDGLADAYNTALLFAKMEREEELVLNPYYESARREEKTEALAFSLGDILKGIDLSKITT